MNKFFNTTGPCNYEDHYTYGRSARPLGLRARTIGTLP
jgi:hypothetical protein